MVPTPSDVSAASAVHESAVARLAGFLYPDDPGSAEQARAFLAGGAAPPSGPDDWPDDRAGVSECLHRTADQPEVLVRVGQLVGPTLWYDDDDVLPSWFNAVLWCFGDSLPSVVVLEAVLTAGGVDEVGALVRGAFFGCGQDLFAAPGFDQAVCQHWDALVGWWQAASVDELLGAVDRLHWVGDATLALVAGMVAESVVAYAKVEREAGGFERGNGYIGPDTLVERLGPVLDDTRRRLAVDGSAARRKRALTALWRDGDAETKQWAVTIALADAAPSVRALPVQWSPALVVTPPGRDGIETTARAGIPNGLPRGVARVVEGLPPLRWADLGRVPDVVWHWWVHLAVQSKRIEPAAALRTAASLLDPASAQVFADALLRAWIADDTEPRPVDEAMAAASAHADKVCQYATSPGHSGRFTGKTPDEIRATILRRHLERPGGSAGYSKGMLALVAAFGARDVAGPVAEYLDTWARRESQAKALIELLAWVGDAVSVQLLSTLGDRLRRWRLVAHAREVSDALAARRGVPVWEMFDQSVPDAGLDTAGRLRLSYGPRSFVATLNDDLTWTVHDQAGRVQRGLPPVRSTDDPAAVATAKMAFAQAKAAVKDIVEIQAPRLRNHMAAGRRWTVQQWREQIADHPVMSRLGHRLVWVAESNCPFRLLADGTLTDVHDHPVTLHPDGTVRLAHSTRLTPDERRAWQVHLADYEVVAPFDQLGTDPLVLTADDLTRLNGVTLDRTVFRRLAKCHGFREETDSDFVKFYPAAQITADLSYTRVGDVVTLAGLWFRRGTRKASWPLSGISPAILTETWADVCDIAAAGHQGSSAEAP
ncbi:MAG: DUF4132 domain-containing protein [Micrococcales bacterium]|nr:DUF4132 domain-containing protein [Micrococcales bacterium]